MKHHPLNSREAALIDAFRGLPTDTADQVLALVLHLAAGAPQATIDWSDAWSENDLREFRAASLRNLEREEAELPACPPRP
jgi:hypothetical protein